MVKKKNLGFENSSFIFEASELLGVYSKPCSRAFVIKKLRMCDVLSIRSLFQQAFFVKKKLRRPFDPKSIRASSFL